MIEDRGSQGQPPDWPGRNGRGSGPGNGPIGDPADDPGRTTERLQAD